MKTKQGLGKHIPLLIMHLVCNVLLLCCAFIDYQKAFDTISRSGLWSKLIASGISGFFLKCLEILPSVLNHVFP